MMVPSVAVHALGMGEIEVRSALNEPLKAHIKLSSATAAELSALQVALASNEAFSRMGIERTPALRDLRFEVVTQGVGAPYISIVSDLPMREPFLDLILMANWSNGQLMREYTLLLDPPVFDESRAVAPVMAAKTEAAAIERGQKKEAAPAAPATTSSRGESAKGYGPTSRTDTLWTVARDMRPNSSVTVPQMMIALLKENPEAFADGNVNNLKSGYILRSPSMDVINSVSSSQAAAETNRHYQEWQATGGKSPVTGRRQQVAVAPVSSSEPATARSAAVPAAPVAGESGARLKLLSPEEAKQQGGAGGGSAGQGKGAVTEQLAMALETAEATKQENADLKERLTDLERQLQAVQRLLTLKGDTLGALQAGLGEPGQMADGQAGAGAPPMAAVDPAAQPATVAPADKHRVAPAAKPAPAAPVVQPQPVAETTLIDQIMADPVLLGASAGGPLLILLAAMLIRRRRQQAELREIDGLGGLVLPVGEDGLAKSATAAAGAVSAPKAVPVEENFGEMIDDAVATDFSSGSGMGAIHTEENEIDPIAEADVYLAYRRYEQAEALLKEAIRHDSGRNELKLKLLEIYFTTKDKESFEAQAEALYASLGGREDELWSQAVEMGREISPEHPLFAEAGGIPAMPGAGLAIAGAVAATAASAADEFSFEDAVPTDLADEFSFDLSDDALASSLDLHSLDKGAGGDLLDLDGIDDSGASLSSLDDVELAAAEGLEELSTGTDEFSLDSDHGSTDDLMSLDDDFAVIGNEEFDLEALEKLDVNDELTDNQFSLDDDLAGGDLLNELGSDFDDLNTGADFEQVDELRDSDAGEAVAAQAGSPGSDKWTIAPAISSFNSRDVKSEMDDGYVPVTNVSGTVIDEHDLNHLTLDDADLDLGGELDGNIFDGSDDILGTKLDLARAYIDMGDPNGARSILDEVVKEGDDSHRHEAEQLMRQIS